MLEEGVLVFRGKERVWIEMNTPPHPSTIHRVNVVLAPSFVVPVHLFIQVNIFFSFSFRSPSVSLTFSAFPVATDITVIYRWTVSSFFTDQYYTGARGPQHTLGKTTFWKISLEGGSFPRSDTGKRLMEASIDFTRITRQFRVFFGFDSGYRYRWY